VRESELELELERALDSDRGLSEEEFVNLCKALLETIQTSLPSDQKVKLFKELCKNIDDQPH